MSNLDLNTLPPDLLATLTKKETDGERRVRLLKDMAVFAFALIVLGAAFLWSADITLDHAASPDDKHTAQTIIAALVGGLIGYLLKK